MLDDEIQDLFQHGFIESLVRGWRSPAILVQKLLTIGEPSYSLVFDYQKLNKLSIPQHFPMITVNEIWEMVGQTKAKIVFSLDFLKQLSSAQYGWRDKTQSFMWGSWTTIHLEQTTIMVEKGSCNFGENDACCPQRFIVCTLVCWWHIGHEGLHTNSIFKKC